MSLSLNITYDLSVSSAPAAFTTAVNAVVQFFDSHFSDSVTINIHVGYGEVDGQPLGGGALGESTSFLSSFTYAQIRNALASDAKSTDDTTALASLPASDPIGGSHNYWVTTADAKALGLASGNSIDGYVGFSSSANIFDYDNSNGVTAGQYDFFGVVEHEISEIMGRQMMDGETFSGSTSYEPLDLFHYSAPGTRDLLGTTAGYFSINGGTTNLDNFNTNPGGDFGDWASSAGNDFALAFSFPSAVNSFGSTDLRLMDVLGWDSIGAAVNHAPVVTASDTSAGRNTSIAFTTLVSASDADNDPLTYEFWDATSDPNSGHLVINGVAQPPLQNIFFSQSQLSQVRFQTGTTSDDLYVRVSDGTVTTAWTEFHVNVPANHAPTVSAPDASVARNASVSFASLVSASDADNDPLTYEFWDATSDPKSGHLMISGVAQPPLQNIFFSQSQLSQVSFQAGTTSDDLYVRVSDGTVTTAWTEFHVNVPANHAPTVSAPDASVARNASVSFASLVSAIDADNDPLTYEFWDATSDPKSGHLVINGVAQPPLQNIFFSQSQLSQVSFQAGTTSDDLYVRVSDGTVTTAWTEFHVNVPANHAPTVSASDVTLPSGHDIVFSTLVSASDQDGDALSYEFWDATSDPNSGHLVINGVAQAALQNIFFSQAQLGSVTFHTGTTGDDLYFRVSDGTVTTAWTEFHVGIGPNHAPVVTASDKSMPANTSASFSTMFSASDADGDVLSYEFWDATSAATSGHLLINGIVQPALQNIFFSQAQLGAVTFQSGTTGDDLYVRASDGTATSAWTLFHVVVSPGSGAFPAQNGDSNAALDTMAAGDPPNKGGPGTHGSAGSIQQGEAALLTSYLASIVTNLGDPGAGVLSGTSSTGQSEQRDFLSQPHAG